MNPKIQQLFEKNNGLITSSLARECGISNKALQYLVKSGEVERIEHGLYMSPDFMKDIYFAAQYRCRKGVFSHETALYFHGLSDRTPICLMMTIPNGYNSRLLKQHESYKFFYSKPILYDLGIVTCETPFGNSVHVYDMERTICDCIKKRKYLDSDLVLSAVKRYMNLDGNNHAKLLNYAETFKIREIVKQYLEVLL